MKENDKSKERIPGDGDPKKLNWAEKLACSAIFSIKNQEDGSIGEPQGHPEEYYAAEADDFLKTCQENDVWPLDVVYRTAEQYEIDVFGDIPVGDSPRHAGEERCRVYNLLRAVVKRVVLSIMAVVVDKSGFGPDSVVQAVLNLLALGRKEGEPKSGAASKDVLFTKVLPLYFRYAVSW